MILNEITSSKEKKNSGFEDYGTKLCFLHCSKISKFKKNDFEDHEIAQTDTSLSKAQQLSLQTQFL